MKHFTVKIKLNQFVLLALLLALGIVCAKLTFGSNLIKVSPSFIPNSLIGMIGGPLWAGITLALGDILGALFSGTPYFPGFTFSAFFVGGLYGLFFYKKSLNVKRGLDWLYTFVAMTVIMLVDSTFFNTLWVTLLIPHHTFHTFLALLSARSLLLIQIPIKTLVIMLIIPNLQAIKPIQRVIL